MNPRISLLVWILLLHLIILGCMYALLKSQPFWFFAAEGISILSFAGFMVVYHRIMQPVKHLSEGITRMKEQDFSGRLNQTGDAKLDHIVDFYNKMMEQLRSERAHIRSQHHFLDLLINASPLGILILDFDERISQANPTACRILGISPETSFGKNPAEINNPLAQEIAGLTVNSSQILKMNGFQQFRIQKATFTDRGFSHPFVLIEELTDEISKAEKESYTRVIRMMSHEVNNTVGAINSIMATVTEFLKESESAETSYLQALEIAIQRNESLNRFMANFAGVVRLPQPTKNKCKIEDIMHAVVVLSTPLAKQRNITIESDYCKGFPEIMADSIMLEQALINALKNAIEASPDNASVQIYTHIKPLRLTIQNTGEGITPELRERLFSPFYSTKPNGQGIGLMLIREIMVRHDFRFMLETNGGVTDFTVWFE